MQIKQPYTMIISSPQPNGWGNHPNGIGMNISEPIYSSSAYYTPEPKTTGPDDFTGDDPGWYDNAKATPGGTFVNRPMETTQVLAGLTPPQDSLSQFRPLVIDAKTGAGKGLLQTGTTLNYKTLFLQRLANPSMAYDPINNPYRTVDWLPVDLTVFNGTDYNKQDGTHGWISGFQPSWMLPQGQAADGKHVVYQAWDYDDPVVINDPNYTAGKHVRFGSRQRGGNATTAAALLSSSPGSFNLNLWTR